MQLQQWAYDDAGNLKSRTTVNGERQDFEYDKLNRKIGMSWSNDNGDSASYGYDDASRLTSANNPNSTVTRVYDAAGRLTQDQQNVIGLGIKDVTYPLYDDDGKVKQISAAGDLRLHIWLRCRRDGSRPFRPADSVKFQYAYDAASNETHRYLYLSGVHRSNLCPRQLEPNGQPGLEKERATSLVPPSPTLTTT